MNSVADSSEPSPTKYDEQHAYDAVRKNPETAIKLMASNQLTPSEIYYAALALATVDGSGIDVTAVLISLLKNQDPLVREGAVQGLGIRVERGDRKAREAILKVYLSDKNEAIKSIAHEFL